jgi:hypothetical protein
MTYGVFAPKRLSNYLVFQLFDWVYTMKIIPETHRAHLFRYLHLYTYELDNW